MPSWAGTETAPRPFPTSSSARFRSFGGTRKFRSSRRGLRRLGLLVVLADLLRDALAEGVLPVAALGAVGRLERLSIGGALGRALLGGVLELGGVLLVLLVGLLLLGLGSRGDALAERVLAVAVRAVLARRAPLGGESGRILSGLLPARLGGIRVRVLRLLRLLGRLLLHAGLEGRELRLECLPRGVRVAAPHAALALRGALVAGVRRRLRKRNGRYEQCKAEPSHYGDLLHVR